MTSPGLDPARLKTAAAAVGADKPQLAYSLATSDLSDAEMHSVGGFTSALSLQVARRLASSAGASTVGLSAAEKNGQAAIGDPIEDEQDDSRSWFEKATDAVAGALSNTGNFLIHNWASTKLFEGLDWLGDAAHMPFRVLSDQLDGSNNDEIDAQMKAQGYDPESTTSYFAFMFSKGEDAYHDLNGVRDDYGDDDVDLALKVLDDPEQFQTELLTMKDQDRAEELRTKLQNPDFQNVLDAVDRKHISPGRDLARLLLPEGDSKKSGPLTEDGWAFTALSGALDGAYDWFSDPTLIVGKAAKTARAMEVITGATDASRLRPSTWLAKGIDTFRGGRQRAGLAVGTDSLVDGKGVEALLATDENGAVTPVGQAWDSMLADATEWRDANKAGDEARAAGIWAGAQRKYGDMMSLWDEINGARVIPDAGELSGYRIDKLTESAMGTNGHGPIEDLARLRDHLTSTNGLLRITNGWAARKNPVMPGRLSLYAELRGRRVQKSTEKWINYARPEEFIPTDAEAEVIAKYGGADTVIAGLAQHRLMNSSAIFQPIRVGRAKAERVRRRFIGGIPSVDRIDLGDTNSPKIVEQIARTYLNRGDAARIASAYQAGGIAERRAILRGAIDQAFHASGLSRSEQGQNFMERFLLDHDAVGKQQYGYGDTSLFQTERGPVQAALYPDQISRQVLIPSFREMSHLAGKFAVAGFASKTKLAYVRSLATAPGMDKLIGAIKMGWITSAAGGLRNALDEIANFATYGMLGDVAAARVTYTRATEELRSQRREAAKARLDLIKQYGRTEADDRISRELLDHTTGYEQALRDLERARDAETAVAAVPNRLMERVRNAASDKTDAEDFHARAQAELGAADPELMTEEEIASLQERADWAKKHLSQRKDALRRHKRAYDKRDDAVAKVQQSFDDRGVPSVTDAEAQLAASKKELERAQLLSVAISHRLPYAFRVAGDTVNDKLVGVVLGKVMSYMGKDWMFDEQHIKWAKELLDPEVARVARDGLYQAHQADVILKDASDHTAMDYSRAGVMSRRYAFRPDGYGMVEADGGAGLDAWADNLRLRFQDTNSPAHAWVQTMAGLYRPGMTHEEWQAAFEAARDSIVGRLDDEELRHFVDQAEAFQWYKGAPTKGDPELQRLAREEYANRVSADLAELLSARTVDGAGGGLNMTVLKELADGRVPDRSWLAQNTKTADRPSHAIGQLWAPYNPAHAPGQFSAGYLPFLTRAYEKVVTDQINALSRNPLAAALYMRMRERTQGFVKGLVDDGWDPSVADDMAKRISMRHAEAEAFRHIDNPYVSSQFSMLARNTWAFVRAQEDWLQRWGRTIKDNPELIREAQLLIHGGTSTGILEQDDTGQLHFLYPGSGLAMDLLNQFFGALGQDNMAQVPVQGELSSQLQFLNPSLDNPLGFSGTPLISLPWKLFSRALGPQGKLFSASMDKVINGELGAGRQWWEQLFPSAVNRIIRNVVDSGDNSAVPAAAMQTLAQMAAAGQLSDPKYQTPEGKNDLLHKLQVGTHNNLAMNTILGFFLPAAPQYSTEATEGADGFQGNTPDFAAHLAGIRSLKDEARKVFSTLPFEDALAWWQKHHPNELVLAPVGAASQTTVGTASASAPATIAAAEHVEHNADFFSTDKGYGGPGGLAAYFIPQGKAGTVNGSFSDVAYRAQLELGIRDYKDLSSYYDDLVLSRGLADYFDEKDKYDEAVAKAAHSPTAKSRLDKQWADTRDELKAANPMLAQRLAAYAADNAIGGQTIARLYTMVDDTRPSTVKALGANRDGVIGMLQAQAQYKQATDALGDRRGSEANRRRAAARASYNATIKSLAEQYPGLADLARGAFRTID